MADPALSRGTPAAPAKPLPALHRLFPGVFYGWVVSAGASLLSFACVGVGFYGMPIFLYALAETHGWPNAQLSGATSLYFVTAGLAGPLVGRLVDRAGGRGVIACGALLLGTTVLFVGRIDAPSQLYLAYPVMALGFAMSGGVPTGAIVTRWFVRRRALAMTFTHTGVSVGGVVLVPTATWLVETRGLEAATWLLAAVVLGIALPVTWLALRFDPRDHGLEPDGGLAPPDASRAPRFSATVQQRRWGTREVLGTRVFWMLALAFSAILFCQQAVLVHQLNYLSARFDPGVGARAVGVVAFASALGRLLVGGLLADRLDRRVLGVALFGLQACALVALTLAPDTWSVYAAALAFGFTIGNIFMFQSLLVGDLFGMVSFGTAMGMLSLGTQVAGGLGPAALGLLVGMLGGYEAAIRILAGVAVIAAGALLRVRPPPPAPVAGANAPATL